VLEADKDILVSDVAAGWRASPDLSL